METQRIGKGILYGLVTIFLIAVLTSLIFSLLLRFTGLSEESVSWMILAISFLAVFAGGFVSGGKGKQKGWLAGAATALIYTGIVLLFQFLGYGKLFTLEQTLYHGAFLVVCALGGMFGVNLAGDKK
ncbi:TIGR04086 family membrane protein [Bacillus lacus]|uniref:TIGR04086 family membrane protein n=1 Tax=Metabacillus lacus TaxID=1983721 RepID=A0A7X2IXG0_9BACI|nr:TIGR04086 family membrane protein [Metabacillus lacus]